MKDRLRKVLDELIYLKEVINQEDFALKLDYDKSYVSNLLNGKRIISHKMAMKLENKFNINGHWLLTGVGDMFINQSASKQADTLTSNKNISEQAKELEDYNVIGKDLDKTNDEDQEAPPVNTPPLKEKNLLFSSQTSKESMTERLLHRAFDALEKKDEQIDRLITIIEVTAGVSGVREGIKAKKEQEVRQH